MEPRIVKIIMGGAESQKVLNSTATTLGELKQEMTAAGIDYTDMLFYCGEMKAELKEDTAPLPESVVWKGVPKTSLTFMLTQPAKKITSGMDRKEAYSFIKEHNLTKELSTITGKNYTNCTNQELFDFVASKTKIVKKETKKELEPRVKETIKVSLETAVDVLNKIVKILYEKDVIYFEEYKEFTLALENNSVKENLSQSEIDEMFGNWTK